MIGLWRERGNDRARPVAIPPTGWRRGCPPARRVAAHRHGGGGRAVVAVLVLAAMGVGSPARAAGASPASIPGREGAALSRELPEYARYAWRSWTEEEGLPGRKVYAVLATPEAVWAGTEGGLARLEEGRVTAVIREEQGLPFRAVTSLSQDPETGDLWVGTFGGLARISAGRVDTFTQLSSGLVNDVVYGVLARPGGEVWVATAAGVDRYDARNDAWEIYDTHNTQMHEPWCYGLSGTADRVYVAVWGGGVLEVDPATRRFKAYRDPDGEMELDLLRNDGLVSDVVSGVTLDPGTGTLWAATYFGINRYDGRHWQSYSQADSGLISDFVNTLEARDGVVWSATDRGLSAFDGTTWASYRLAADGQGEVVVRREGEETSQTLPTRGALASDSVLNVDVVENGVWVATEAGLSLGTRFLENRP